MTNKTLTLQKDFVYHIHASRYFQPGSSLNLQPWEKCHSTQVTFKSAIPAYKYSLHD